MALKIKKIFWRKSQRSENMEENNETKKMISNEEIKEFFRKAKEERIKASGKEWIHLPVNVPTEVLFLNDGIERKDTQYGFRFFFNLGAEHFGKQLAATGILASLIVDVLVEKRNVAARLIITKTGKGKGTRYSVVLKEWSVVNENQ